VEVDVIEASDRVGGRVQTDHVQGFMLDRGFQILITAYPEVRRQLDLKALELRSFLPGAVLASNGKLSYVAHPLKCPRLLPEVIKTACGWGLLSSCLDVFRLLGLVSSWLCTDPYASLQLGDATPETTESYLAKRRLSRPMLQNFFRPFFEAIYVSRLEEQSSSIFQFVLRMIACGEAALPAKGMRAIPEQMSSRLKKGVELNAAVSSVTATSATINGERRTYDAVVVAAEWPAAAKLISLPQVQGTQSRTYYFRFPEPAPVTERLVILQTHGLEEAGGSEDTRLVNIAFPSVVQPSYAPRGEVLAAATTMGPAKDEKWVLSEVERLLGVQTSAWEHLKTYDLRFHQPAQVGRSDSIPVEKEGVFCCGDHMMSPTLDGAMLSGRTTAQAVLAKLKAS